MFSVLCFMPTIFDTVSLFNVLVNTLFYLSTILSMNRVADKIALNSIWCPNHKKKKKKNKKKKKQKKTDFCAELY